jgi:L,D-peptidoglycan transpeptidase YkuD (ErfK/YbiS/YcfS/YnhG family)
MDISVSPDDSAGSLRIGPNVLRCAIGRGGIAQKGGEGDGITPVGTFPIRRVLFRPDRVARPKTGLPVAEIARDDGWCDAPQDANYNLPVKLPYPASAESLWREDHLYDVVVVLGYNDDPVVPGKGSAIFLHVAKPDYATTEGCVAFALPDLLKVLELLKPGDSITITR